MCQYAEMCACAMHVILGNSQYLLSVYARERLLCACTSDFVLEMSRASVLLFSRLTLHSTLWMTMKSMSKLFRSILDTEKYVYWAHNEFISHSINCLVNSVWAKISIQFSCIERDQRMISSPSVRCSAIQCSFQAIFLIRRSDLNWNLWNFTDLCHLLSKYRW